MQSTREYNDMRAREWCGRIVSEQRYEILLAQSDAPYTAADLARFDAPDPASENTGNDPARSCNPSEPHVTYW